jgi:hypothetical protein
VSHLIQTAHNNRLLRPGPQALPRQAKRGSGPCRRTGSRYTVAAILFFLDARHAQSTVIADLLE